eukprot:SAG31_NODE_356_length_17180_cov_7.595925_7_plen_79_part_00
MTHLLCNYGTGTLSGAMQRLSDVTLTLLVTIACRFDYRGHICMVFEPLGTSLYDFLSKNDYQGALEAQSIRHLRASFN